MFLRDLGLQNLKNLSMIVCFSLAMSNCSVGDKQDLT